MIKKNSCYIHYMVSKDSGKTSKIIFDEIYQRIKDNNLLEFLDEINIVICGKKEFFPSLDSLEKCKIADCVDNVHLHEFPTLCKVYDDCQTLTDDSKILYLHLKGVTSNLHTWRKNMLDAVVSNYETCVKSIDEGYSSAGPMLTDLHLNGKLIKVYAGNFWWASAKHIKTLPNPTRENLSSKYGWMIKNRRNKNPHAPADHAFRYLAEFWISMSNTENYNMKEVK